ncbi:MAG: hypothetical protein RIB67_11185 [Miltoncostaeaceae bacterium]
MPQRTVAIMAYGSLIDDPGPELAPLIVRRPPRRTAFPVEYARASPRWGGGPVLVPHPAGGEVEGRLLVLADAVELGAAVQMLAAREGLPDARGVVLVDCGEPYAVLAAALPRNLPAPDMMPVELARRAIASAATGARNGIAYLRRAMASGVLTPLSREYAAEVCTILGVPDLEAAERLVALPGFLAAVDPGRIDGLG